VTVKALAVGETPGADMTTDALDKFNDVLETLSIQNLTVYSNVTVAVPLVTSQAVYTLGRGGIGQRPLSMDAIDSAYVSYNGVDFDVEIVPQDQYDALAIKTVTGIPRWAAFNGGYPDTVLSLWPVPYMAAVLTVRQKQQIARVSALTDTVDLPPGYRRLIRLMLAWDLRTDYPGMTPQELQNLKDDVASAKGAVKRSNLEPVLMRSEVADLDCSAGGGYVNWRDGA
jgi:hypothetical protein